MLRNVRAIVVELELEVKEEVAKTVRAKVMDSKLTLLREDCRLMAQLVPAIE